MSETASAQPSRDAAADAVVVPLRFRRHDRAEMALAALDGVSSINLALEARERLARGGGAAALGWAELAVAALLAAATVAVLRGRRRFGRWVSGLAGIVLLLDGLSKTYGPKGHPSWALTLNGLLLIALALIAPRLEARRASRRVLRLAGDGITYRRNRWQGFAVRREDVVALSIGERDAALRLRDGGEHKIDLAGLHDRSEAEAALRAWAATHDVPTNGA